MLTSACKPGTPSRTQSIKNLQALMPEPACKPVRTVLDDKGNAKSSKFVCSRQGQKQRLGASVRTCQYQRLGVSPMRTRNNTPPGHSSTHYYAYFPNDIFRGAIKGYLSNVYGRKLKNVGATLTPRTPSVTSDSSWIIIGELVKQA